jgi:hypothetical protein
MFPSDWAHQTGHRKKRKVTEDPKFSKSTIGHREDDTDIDSLQGSSATEFQLPSQILKSVNTSQVAPATPDELDLDVILSNVPYKEILENLYGRDQRPTSDVPVVSRIYEETFMREPSKGERACVSGELCECNFIDPCMPFTAVEFVPPGMDYPPTPNFCVLCSRKVTQKLFYDILFTGKEAHGVIQRYGNICGVPGEYAKECMLVCPPHAPLHCMPLPIMSHQRNKYRVRISNGVKCLDQVRVRHEDFVNPSTEGQS